MGTTFTDLYNQIYRDFTTPDVQSSGKWDPEKDDIRQLGAALDAAFAAAVSSMLQFTTVAAAQAAAAVDPGTQAHIFYNNGSANDPDNGVYVNPTGAVGGYVKDTAFYAQVALVVQPLVTEAEEHADDARQAAIQAGGVSAQVSQVFGKAQTLGTTSPSTLNIGNPQIEVCCATPLPDNGIVPAVTIKTAVAINGLIIVREPVGSNSYQVVTAQAVSLAVGANTFALPLAYYPKGSLVSFYNTTGGTGGILYDATGPYVRFTNTSAPTVGSAATVAYDSTNSVTPAISYQFIGPNDDDMWSLLETIGVLQTIGITTPSTGAVGNALVEVACPTPTPAVGFIRKVRVRVNAAGIGAIIVRVPTATLGTYQVASVQIVNLAAGVNEVTLPLAEYPAGAIVDYMGLLKAALMYDTTGSYRYFTNATAGVPPAVGTSAAMTNTTGVNPAIQYDFYAATTSALKSYISTFGTALTIGDLSPTGAYVGNATVELACATPLPEDGYVGQVQVNVQNAGVGCILVRSPTSTDGTYSVTDVITFLANGGLNNVTMPLTKYPQGSLITYYPLVNARCQYGTSGQYVSFINTAGTAPTVGSAGAASYATGVTPSLSFTFTPANLNPLPSGVDLEGPVAEAATRFSGTTAPTGWTLGANATISNGLSSSGTALADIVAAADQAIFGTISCAQNRWIDTKFAVTSASAVFMAAVKPNAQTATAPDGAMVAVDGSAGTLGLYTYAKDATYALVTSVSLAAALVAGRNYSLQAKWKYLTLVVKLTDCLTGTVTTLNYTFGSTGARPTWHGYPVVAASSGASCIRARFTVPGAKRKKVLILGDSICEGTGQSNPPASGYKTTMPSWAALMGQDRDDVVVHARAGASTYDMLKPLAAALALHKPDYVILPLGNNDGNITNHRAWMGTAINMVRSAGATPILCTLTPMPSSAATYQAAVNADILANYYGYFTVIDFGAAVSQNNDRVTWIDANNSGDSNHPSTAGQAAMFAQAQIDAPFLWEEAA